MNKYFLLFVIHYSLFIVHCDAQNNKMGNTWIIGWGGMNAVFTDTARPIVGQISTSPTTFPYNFIKAHSNICDSSTGKLILMCNSMWLIDTLGNIIDKGDSLQPSKIYATNNPPQSTNTQGSLILPKDNNDLYYVFTPTVTDSTYTKFVASTIKFPYDLLQYHVVDMKANNGAGKVIQKNIPLITNNEISQTGMMAVRHANGYDWWLLKQGFDTNKVYTFLVTKDTVLLDTIQYFAEPTFGFNGNGQSCFSADGSKYAYVYGLSKKLFIADFDRCYGILSNPKVFNTPVDSTTHPFWTLDSGNNGLCFSENNKYLYLSQSWHIYQFEFDKPDSTIAWFKVKQGPDTSFQFFSYYGQLYRGIDNRIYIGKFGGQGKQMSVIDYPNLKGTACGFCRMCLRNDNGLGYIGSPPNMPDFNLGALPYSCPPLNTGHLAVSIEQLEVYPNPASSILYIKNKKGKKKALYNSVGQLILTTKANEVDIHCLPKGLYYITCDGISQKVMIE